MVSVESPYFGVSDAVDSKGFEGTWPNVMFLVSWVRCPDSTFASLGISPFQYLGGNRKTRQRILSLGITLFDACGVWTASRCG
jgi:hypothetical protein